MSSCCGRVLQYGNTIINVNGLQLQEMKQQKPMFKRRTASIMDGLFPNPSTPNNVHIYADPTHVRDQLLLKLEEWSTEPFCRPFQRHIAQMHPRSLDTYSRIKIYLFEYDVTVTVLTGSVARQEHDLVYKIHHLDRNPNRQLTQRPSLFCWP